MGLLGLQKVHKKQAWNNRIEFVTIIGVDYFFWGQELGDVEPLVGQVHGFGGVLDGSVRVPVLPIRT